MQEIKALSKIPSQALEMALPHASYLARLARRFPDLMAALDTRPLDELFAEILNQTRQVGDLDNEADVMRDLRHAKQKAHLVLAAADLSGKWPVMEITAHMTAFADGAVRAALAFCLKAAGLKPAGLFLVALGKMGAQELNYSSDIDIAAFYDRDVFDGGARSPGDAAARIIKQIAKLLEDNTRDGYVLRTDLRLRPDPRSTPVAVSTRMAELYYESVGQNWERMVWIKARPFAGDLDCADQFLSMLQSFVWRQHLDYWAINDIQAIKAMINASADRASLEAPDADVKLGAGGIREIEFFAQTQQLILGGRDKSLRIAKTLGALEALIVRGAVEADTGDALAHAYQQLRHIEHRIQMREDQQTHSVPTDDIARAQIAMLCGQPDLTVFDANVRALRRLVHGHYRALFHYEDGRTETSDYGNLVFTGVDDDPGTVTTLTGFGFKAPARVIDTIRHWHRGHTSATRTVRGRELLTALLPALLSDMSITGEPDQAFGHFTTFFEALPSGVQTLSMLQAEADLRRDLIATLALAPRLGLTLGRKPNLLEALLQRSLVTAPSLTLETDFETAMDKARIYVRDQAFLIGHDLLHGRVAASDSAQAFSGLADWSITAMAGAAEAECTRRFGPPPGDWCIAALGRLGGEAMTAASDLDIMVIYKARADNAQQWFTRFTQRLITALSAQTSQGRLYEVDMRLRPSGGSGPVAVRLRSFEKYHKNNAWTWERMALTRLRPIVDRGGLGESLAALCRALLAMPRDREALQADVLDMRERLARDKAGKGLWDLKLGTGGLVDIEFIVQHGLLCLQNAAASQPLVRSAIAALESAGQVPPDQAETLLQAHIFLSSLQQIQRLALNGDIDPENISAGLKDRLLRAVGSDDFGNDFDALTARLVELKTKTADIFTARIGELDRPRL